jgi:hypothetical protein
MKTSASSWESCSRAKASCASATAALKAQAPAIGDAGERFDSQEVDAHGRPRPG